MPVIRGSIMSYVDDYYDEVYRQKAEAQNEKYNQIIKEFECLSLEEKVNTLIRIYALEEARKFY